MDLGGERGERIHDDGAVKALRSIESGGHHLLMLARRRVGELLNELDEGDFREAHSTAQALASTLTPLASAQAYIAIADGSKLMAARDLRPGMVLTDLGEITEHHMTECAIERCRGHVKLKIGEHDVEYSGDVELYVDVSESSEPS